MRSLIFDVIRLEYFSSLKHSIESMVSHVPDQVAMEVNRVL